jgi:hypothetical protein
VARKLETAGRSVTWDPHFPDYRRCHSADDHGDRLEFREGVKD